MDRKATARETLQILANGFYTYEGRTIEIASLQKKSVEESILYTPDMGENILQKYKNGCGQKPSVKMKTVNISTVDALLQLEKDGKENVGILNFASAKNPGGGFINGAMAQEESLATSGGLYKTLTANEEYYKSNRACPSMIYTDYAIYSPEVVFFRDGRFQLLERPVTASVLTLPAVNMGQVRLKGESEEDAQKAMKHRMELALALLAENGARTLILGAYGCGVFRNDPKQIAGWWRELLDGTFADYFEEVVFAVLDKSKDQACYRAFNRVFEE